MVPILLCLQKSKKDRNVMVHYFGRICFGGMLRIMNSVLSTSHFLEWKRQESRKNNRKRAGKGKDAFNILRCFNWKADVSVEERRHTFFCSKMPETSRVLVVYKTDLPLLRMVYYGLKGTSAGDFGVSGSTRLVDVGPMSNFSAGCWSFTNLTCVFFN